MRKLFLASIVLTFAGCSLSQEAGVLPGAATFGDATNTNNMAQQVKFQEAQYLVDAGVRFEQETDEKAFFAFNRATLTQAARKALDSQAKWLRENPDVRMTVTGHTDLVGGEDYNQRLGLRRAEAAARYLVARGIDAGRVEAVESRGESDPQVPTEDRERQNRRAVTTVAGFIHGYIGENSDGRRARSIYRRYVTDSIETPAAASSTGG